MKEGGKRILCIVLSFAVCVFSLFNFEYDSYAAEQSGAEMTESAEEQQSGKDEPDIDREDAGYVVVGAEKENAPIIEFRTSGKFLDEKLQSDEYLLYDGGINYYKVDEVTNQATSLDGSRDSVSVEDIPTIKDEAKDVAAEENKDEWNMLLSQARSSSGESSQVLYAAEKNALHSVCSKSGRT